MRALSFGLGLVLVISASAVQAGSPFVGQEKAQGSCSQCHGMKKPADGSIFPQLAGRDGAYLRKALQQYRDKTRKSEVMNNIAGSLSDEDINHLVSYYSNVKP